MARSRAVQAGVDVDDNIATVMHQQPKLLKKVTVVDSGEPLVHGQVSNMLEGMP